MKIGQVLVSTFLYVPLYSQVKGSIKLRTRRLWNCCDRPPHLSFFFFASGTPHMIAVTEHVLLCHNYWTTMIVRNGWSPEIFFSFFMQFSCVAMPFNYPYTNLYWNQTKQVITVVEINFTWDLSAIWSHTPSLLKSITWKKRRDIMAKINCGSHIIW